MAAVRTMVACCRGRTALGGKGVAAGGGVDGGGVDCAQRAGVKNAWQDEGARGDEDRREDGRRSAEGGGAAGRGTVACAGRGVEHEGAWLGAQIANGAQLSPTTKCSVRLCVCVSVCLCVRMLSLARGGAAVTSGGHGRGAAWPGQAATASVTCGDRCKVTSVSFMLYLLCGPTTVLGDK